MASFPCPPGHSPRPSSIEGASFRSGTDDPCRILDDGPFAAEFDTAYRGADTNLATALGFGALCAAMFMAILDIQIVATSLPTIQEALAIAPENLSWIQTAYLLAEVISIPLTGPFQRTLGLRRLVLLALTGFTVASVGCALSSDLTTLLCWRLVRGFAGGVLIPVVFSSVFLIFRPERQSLAAAAAGVTAVLAPTIGPLIGGTITVKWSWHGLFLINVPIGAVASLVIARLVPRGTTAPGGLRSLEWIGLAQMALSLAALVLGLKFAPDAGWLTRKTLCLLGGSGVVGVAFVRRTLASPVPLISLRLLEHRRFAIGCGLSFVFGMGLFGSVYLLPLFLSVVRGHDPQEIGRIMLTTGLAQLAAAPLVAVLDAKLDPRPLTALGFLIFAVGLGSGAWQTVHTDADSLFWPQILRGIGIMFCLVPTSRLALGLLSPDSVPDASGLFNLMRNLGGAIGLALIDTVLYGRSPRIAARLEGGLAAGDPQAARTIGLSPDTVASHVGKALDAQRLAFVTRLVGHAALTAATNDAWMCLAVLTAATLPLLATSRLIEADDEQEAARRPPWKRSGI